MPETSNRGTTSFGMCKDDCISITGQRTPRYWLSFLAWPCMLPPVLMSVLLSVIGLIFVSILTLALAPKALAEADVRLVIDISGSMKRNDLRDLRRPAVDLLMELVTDGSHAGVWTFGQQVNMLVPFGEVDTNWRKLAKEKAESINSVGLYTNIGAALEKATSINRQQNKGHVILLTDGMVDIDKDPEVNQKEWRRIVDELSPKLKERGFAIHTVALSDNADAHLLKTLSQQTDGHTAIANTADDLMPAFLAAFDAAAPAEQLPLSGDAFVVDSSVEEFTALIFRQEGSEVLELIGPDQQVYSHNRHGADVAWYHTESYDLVTLKRPIEGEWRVNGDVAPNSRITVVSDLSLRVKPLPINVSVNAELPVQLALQEQGNVITRPDFLKLLAIEARIFSESVVASKHTFETQTAPKNGVFETVLTGPRVPGSYELIVEVDGKSFQRRYVHRLQVTSPFEATISQQYDNNGQIQYVLTVIKNAQHIAAVKTQIAVSIVTPDRRQRVQPLKLNDMDQWVYAFAPTQEGVHQLTVQVTGTDDKGNPFEYTLNNLGFDYLPGAAFEALVEQTEESSSQSEPAKQAVEPEPASAAMEDSAVDEAAEVEDDQPFPSWMFYALLGVGNLLLVVVGFLLFKKIMSPNDKDPEREEDDAKPPEPEPFDPSQESESIEKRPMELEEGDDDIPPMEDLDPDLTFEEDEFEKAESDMPMPDAQSEVSSVPPAEPSGDTSNAAINPDSSNTEEASSDRIDDDFDFDLSALDEPPAANSRASSTAIRNDSEQVSQPQRQQKGDEDDMQTAMLKAQGLDLAEDELDDAISSLIDELDGESNDNNSIQANPFREQSKKKDTPDNGFDIDDFDFDDDDDPKP